ncbi:MAG: SDR family oxidoreductase [Fidelibacterota bacterium]
MKLDEMIGVVTGAAGGTGPAIVEAMSQRCSAVVGVVRGVEVEWKALGGNVFEATADVASQTSVGFLVSEVLRHMDTFHIWVNLVGGFALGNEVEETEPEDWPRMFNLNFISVLNCCKKILPIFKAQDFGRIINFGSAAGLDGMAKAAPYAVSKAAVINLSRTLALEGKQHGITSNVIVPTVIDTPSNRKTMPDSDFSTWTKPGVIAEEILTLVDSQRTGEIVHV